MMKKYGVQYKFYETMFDSTASHRFMILELDYDQLNSAHIIKEIKSFYGEGASIIITNVTLLGSKSE